jgi:flagellar basal body-associated protein FliL
MKQKIRLFLIAIILALYVNLPAEQKDGENFIIAPPPPSLAQFNLPSFAAGTNDSDPNFINLSVSLGCEKSMGLGAELKKKPPLLQHIINVLLSGKKIKEIDAAEKTINLSEEIKTHINAI